MGIGSILVEKGLISEPQLSEALAEQRRTGERLDRALVRLGLVGSGDLLAAIGQQLSLPVVDLGGLEVEDEILRMRDAQLAR